MRYNWKRFWCPRTGNLNLSDRGFLYDPDSKYGSMYNPDVLALQDILPTPCLALLGEPGLGKSSTMQNEIEIITSSSRNENERFLFFNLRSYGSEDRLIRDIFESHEFVSWINGDYRLHLFLDSLDECLLRINTLATLIIDEMSKYPIERLYLRIACRTAEWPVTLETGLQTLWGVNSFKAFELAPLRRKDIEDAAIPNALDPQLFLAEIEEKQIVPFAIKPVTLQFLINEFKKKHSLPSTQTDLYLKGCLKLCEEMSQQRQDAGLIGKLTATQRMTIAARIALITLFANRYAVWIGRDLGDVPEEDVLISQLVGGRESVDDKEFEVTDDAIKETLDTGLFSSRGLNRMGWAHQTYAECLAAWYLTKNMVIPQIKTLITHPDDPEGKLIPQLHETIAWLGCMIPDLIKEILKTDPEVLLRSDIATIDAHNIENLVSTLLEFLDSEKLYTRDLPWEYLKKLLHPNLPEQLRPYITDKDKNLFTRKAAIDISEACRVRELQNELLRITLDISEEYTIRTEAAHALSIVGDKETNEKLKPLVTGELGDDPDDQLKGSALTALWPDSISAKELFALLLPPKSDRFYGSYRSFIYDLAENFSIKAPDLIFALNWVEEQPSHHEYSYSFRNLVDSIIKAGFDEIENQGIPKELAKVVLSRLLIYDDIQIDEENNKYLDGFINDVRKRRLLLSDLVLLIKADEKKISSVYISPFLKSQDIPWMIEQLKLENQDDLRKTWAELISKAFDGQESSITDAILTSCQSITILSEKFQWLIEPVILGSEEAEAMKSAYYERQKWMNKRKIKKSIKPTPKERIAKLLDEFESGDLSAWWRLNLEMTLKSDSEHYGDEFESNLMELPGWQESDPPTQDRIVQAARKYVLEQNSEPEKWLETNTFYRPAAAGHKALCLLLEVDPNFIESLSKDIWQNWAPAILSHPTPNVTSGKKYRQTLISLSYKNAPDKTIAVLQALIDKENNQHSHIFITNEIKHCWDDRLANVLLLKAKESQTKPESMGCLLSDLFEMKYGEVFVFAESLITIPIPKAGDSRSQALIAARELMLNTDSTRWPMLSAVLHQDPEFGKEVILDVANRSNRQQDSICQRLTEMELANLYIWVVSQFPHREDPQHDGAHTVTPRDNVVNWRDGILRCLQQLGTPEACKAIEYIISKLPDLKWLKWILLDAKKQTRRRSWISPQPHEILKLASNNKMRLVQNGDQLLEILLESLKSLEQKLQGETPAAIDLWNEIDKNVYKPKDENQLSDYVKRHFQEDISKRGIITNREVQIRRGEGNAKGENTDIHVSAIIVGSDRQIIDSVTAIVELKGCWNNDLKNAMQTQLKDRYLKDNQCQYGLYLVGWFLCDQWTDEDYRKRKSPRISIEEARDLFKSQSTELSNSVIIKSYVLNARLR